MKHKIVSFIFTLFLILFIIYIFIYLFFNDSVFVIIGQLIKYGHIDWETKILMRHGRGHRATMEPLRDVFIRGILFLATVILICIVGPIINKIKRTKDINNNINKYCNEFIILFNDSIDAFPSNNDMKKFFEPIKTNNNLGINILNSLITQKIHIIHDMNLLQKYTFFYERNIEKINIGTLSSYNVSSYDVKELINYISIPNYISFKIVSSKEDQKNILNRYEYQNKDELILQMVFDQYLILKDIVLQVFLNEQKNNDIELVKNDILLRIKSTDSEHKKLLISAVKENINENEKFKEKFYEVLNNNYIQKI